LEEEKNVTNQQLLGKNATQECKETKETYKRKIK
jgi:hypothetical protein